MDSRERKLRERAQILREHRATIDRLAKEAAMEVEAKYRAQYGDNWREALSYEQAYVLERNILNEKNNMSSMIEEHYLFLKSSR
mgnify:CR=1 FL=1